MTQRVYILQGLPASGKSTWALNFIKDQTGKRTVKRVNKDDLRRMLDAGKYSKERECFVLNIRDRIIYGALKNGFDIIIDDTNFEEKHIEQIRKIIRNIEKTRNLNISFEIKKFNIDPVEAVKRNSLRADFEQVPEKVIWNMYNRYIKPNEYKESIILKQDESLPHAIICDLDGTLAIHNGRSPYDCMKANTDLLNQSIADIVWAFEEKGLQIIFVSGRNGECYEVTKDWLILNGFRDFILFMREEGDNRKDSIVKKEIYDECIKDQFYVEFVLDDRNQVVDMWRKELGLICLQVAEGDF